MANLVRVRKPKVIVLGLHGTTAPSDWEDQCIFPYVRQQLLPYLQANWNKSDEIINLIDSLRQQSFDDHFVYETAGAPLILSFNDTNTNWRFVLSSVNAYVIWQLGRPHSVKEAVFLAKMCWVEGYKNKAIQTM